MEQRQIVMSSKTMLETEVCLFCAIVS